MAGFEELEEVKGKMSILKIPIFLEE